MKTIRWGVYALALIAGLTIYGHLKLWWEEVEASPAATIYRTRTRTVYVEVPRDKKEEKGLKRVTVPCRPVQVLIPEGTSPDHMTSRTGQTPAARVAEGERSSGALDPHTSDTARMTGMALLGVFRLPPLPEGGSARATLDEAGVAHLEVKAKPRRLFALGSLRELGVWGGVRLDDSSVRTWSLSYQQDILRVGPAMLRGRAEYGDDGFGSGGKAELGIVVRF